MAALVTAIPVGEAAPFPIEMAGTSPAMTRDSWFPDLLRSNRSMLQNSSLDAICWIRFRSLRHQ
jgi:hypothetical protein